MAYVRFLSLDGTHEVAIRTETIVAVRGASHRGIVETVIRTISSAEQVGEKFDDVMRKLIKAEGCCGECTT